MQQVSAWEQGNLDHEMAVAQIELDSHQIQPETHSIAEQISKPDTEVMVAQVGYGLLCN